VSELAFREGVMDRIRVRESRYDEQAYLFILSALEFAQTKLDVRRHITGSELSHACRELALERYGLMARVVLERWGLHATADFGEVVFALVDLGFLAKLPSDTREEFSEVYDFAGAFERDYPWTGIYNA
jgi:uncharacterized repeat protein (TIGR04138 family)